MKKLLSLILAMLMLVMGAVAFADTYNTAASEEMPIYVNLNAEEDPTVIAIDIEWSSDYFAFDFKTSGKVWDPDNIAYEEDTALPTFESKEPVTVTVYNRSNVGIFATCTVGPASHLPEEGICTFVTVGDDKQGYQYTSYFASASEINEYGELVYSRDNLPMTEFVISFEISEEVTEEQLNAIINAIGESGDLGTVTVEVGLS